MVQHLLVPLLREPNAILIGDLTSTLVVFLILEFISFIFLSVLSLDILWILGDIFEIGLFSLFLVSFLDY